MFAPLCPTENPQSPEAEAGGSVGHMSPEDHYRRMMSALSEAGSYEEQQQRLYQLASSMGLPGHGQFTCLYNVLMFSQGVSQDPNPMAQDTRLGSGDEMRF